MTFEKGAACPKTHVARRTQLRLHCKEGARPSNASAAALRVTSISEGSGQQACHLTIDVETSLACPVEDATSQRAPQPARLVQITGCNGTSGKGPKLCPTSGGATVNLHGHFTGYMPLAVSIGPYACTGVKKVSDYLVTCTMSPGFGEGLVATVSLRSIATGAMTSATMSGVGYRLQFDPFDFDPVKQVRVCMFRDHVVPAPRALVVVTFSRPWCSWRWVVWTSRSGNCFGVCSAVAPCPILCLAAWALTT